ncbi:Dynactin subunit 6 [Eumeta japonica]|uniref:Dynactin subunit 6 n=1 Tax=Eumeta variegata TaxID=151549 RepID=A0A4C1ZCL5_EUMVA|nr:Dynactin subunit 6 [Eumeta japonica]
MSSDVESFSCDYLRTTHFSIQLAESTLPGNEALLLAYVRFVMDEEIHEELLFAKTLKTDTKSASCRLSAPQNLADNTVIWGTEHHTREALEKQPSQLLQLDLLSKVMPNYHRLRKPNVHKRQPSRQTQESSPKP